MCQVLGYVFSWGVGDQYYCPCFTNGKTGPKFHGVRTRIRTSSPAAGSILSGIPLREILVASSADRTASCCLRCGRIIWHMMDTDWWFVEWLGANLWVHFQFLTCKAEYTQCCVLYIEGNGTNSERWAFAQSDGRLGYLDFSLYLDPRKRGCVHPLFCTVVITFAEWSI